MLFLNQWFTFHSDFWQLVIELNKCRFASHDKSHNFSQCFYLHLKHKSTFLRVSTERKSPEMLFLLLKCPKTKVNLLYFPLENNVCRFGYPPSFCCARVLLSLGIWTMCFQQSPVSVKLIQMTLTGAAVQLPCSRSSVQDPQAGSSPWSYLHSSCDGVGMTLYNPIPQLYVSLWLQKGGSTAFSFCHTVKTQPPAPRSVICHRTEQSLGSDHSSISDTETLHRNVTLVPTAAISKPGNLTKLQIYTSLQVLPWSKLAATAEWPGLGDLQSDWGTADFPCHSQPGQPPELRE